MPELRNQLLRQRQAVEIFWLAPKETARWLRAVLLFTVRGELVLSAHADSICPTCDFPALTRWANDWRRFAAVPTIAVIPTFAIP